MLNLNNYFEHIEKCVFSGIFSGIRYPWQPINNINKYILEYIASKKSDTVGSIEGIESVSLSNADGIQENIVVVNRPVRLDRDILIKDMDIFIMEGTVLEPGAVIKSPVIIGRDCQVRQGAYIRGNVLTGSRCVLGHTTEIKNSILFNEVEAGHFAYIGDSILGEHVNLGAGTKLANLQFRTREQKKYKKNIEIIISCEGKRYPTGMNKLGAVVGDYTEIGCNTVTSPGALLSKNTWIYPNTTVAKGFYPPDSIIRASQR